MNPVVLRPTTEGVACIELSDEAGHNGLSVPLIDGIVDALEAVASDPEVRAVVLTGTQQWFCSGATRETLREVVSHRISPAELTLGLKIVQTPVPVIAAVEGDTLGGGLALMLACDLLVLASRSRHCANFMTLGITPGMGITHLLGSLLGSALAHELLYTGRSIRAEEFPSGSVNAVVEQSDVRTRAESLAWSIASNDRDNLRLLKATLTLPRREALLRAMSMEALMHESSLPRFDERQMT